LNFDSEIFKNLEKRQYNYWVAYDHHAEGVVATDFENKSLSSLSLESEGKRRLE